jgi:poly(A) polymerase
VVASTVSRIGRRLRLSNAEREHVVWLLTHVDALRGVVKQPLAKLKRLLAKPLIRDLLTLLRVAAECGDGEVTDVEFCEQYLERTSPAEIDPVPLITGDDLIALGLSPGAAFKELLARVRDAQLDGTIATREAAILLVKQLSAAPNAGP